MGHLACLKWGEAPPGVASLPRLTHGKHYFPFWEVGAHLRSRLGCITERPLQLNLCVLPIWQMAVNVNVGTRQMDRHMSAFGTADLHGEESLIFGDMAELGGDVSAEERIKSLLGGDPAERGLARCRVVRRPFGSGGYQAQTIVFSERERSCSRRTLCPRPGSIPGHSMQVCSFHNFFTIFMCFCTILLTFLAPVTAAARRLRVRSTRVKISYAARALPLHFRSATGRVSRH